MKKKNKDGFNINNVSVFMYLENLQMINNTQFADVFTDCRKQF